MPKLEIMNSRFTSKAGEWALLYYARDQKATQLSEIKRLDLSGRGVLHMTNIDIFEQLVNMKTLNISDHPEFFLSQEEIQQEE